jgi:DNA-directed RNA polymerase subunit M/transcription elongation factor TFIIS
MLIKFSCPHCQAALSVGSDFAGKKGACPNCKKELTIPEKSEDSQKAAEKTAKKG